MERELKYSMLAILAVAVGGGIMCAAVRLLSRKVQPSTTLDTLPKRWFVADVALAFFLLKLLQALVAGALGKTGVLQWLYEDDVDFARLALWTTLLASPLVVLCVMLSLHRARGMPAGQIGITAQGFSANVVVGYLTWLALTPPIVILHYAISLVVPIEKHMFEQLASEGALPIDWIALFGSAVVMAPVVEELLFRGVLLGWLMDSPEEGHVGLIVVAVICAFMFSAVGNSADTDVATHASRWAGALHILALSPGYVWLLYKRRRAARAWGVADYRVGMFQAFASIYGSSMLFAAFHAGVWPTPIPLFFLGLSLGWVAHRTGSLVAPITVHGLFNAVACVQLMLVGLR